jgi:hypothetical protein
MTDQAPAPLDGPGHRSRRAADPSRPGQSRAVGASRGGSAHATADGLDSGLRTGLGGRGRPRRSPSTSTGGRSPLPPHGTRTPPREILLANSEPGVDGALPMPLNHGAGAPRHASPRQGALPHIRYCWRIPDGGEESAGTMPTEAPDSDVHVVPTPAQAPLSTRLRIGQQYRKSGRADILDPCVQSALAARGARFVRAATGSSAASRVQMKRQQRVAPTARGGEAAVLSFPVIRSVGTRCSIGSCEG